MARADANNITRIFVDSLGKKRPAVRIGLSVAEKSQLNGNLRGTIICRSRQHRCTRARVSKRDTMKFKTLVASVAFTVLGTAVAGAADVAVKAPLPPPVPLFSWTGWYVGGNIGGAWSHNTWTDTILLTNFNNGGNNGAFIGGGQMGVNYQVGQFVIGGEWDFDWASNNNNGNGVITRLGNIVVTNNNRWITTVAARFGWAVDHWLLYGKAGGGWVGSNNFTVTNLTTGVSFSCGTFGFSSCNNSNGGWLV